MNIQDERTGLNNSNRQGERLAECNHQNKRKLKAQKSKSKLSQYYGIGAVMAIRVLGTLGYYLYQSRYMTPVNQSDVTPVHVTSSYKFDMDKKSIVNDLY